MITNGFTYIAVLILFSGTLLWLQQTTGWKFFDYVPALVLLYLGAMVLSTAGVWDLDATASAYGALKNNILYAMIFLMLLRCDLKKILRLGPKMLGGFLIASVSMGLGFIASFALLKNILGPDSWKAMGALCGSWMGGAGNMLAVQAAFDIGEGDMAYALVVDSVCGSLWIMFLLWAVSMAPKFNRSTKADTAPLEEVCRRLESAGEESNTGGPTFVDLLLLLGLSLTLSAAAQNAGSFLHRGFPFLDRSTWTVLLVTAAGLLGAVSPLGKRSGSSELGSVMLYCVVALLASRGSLANLADAPAWILAGLLILAIHGCILVLFAKIFRLDLFTCSIASLANLGGTASAPILAGSYSGALVTVGVLMALLGYVIGTAGGILVGRIMSML